MLHQDGSRAAWLEGQMLDLIVTMDDATSMIYSAFLVEEEGTASTLRALLEVFCAHGLPSSLYTDRGSHYFYTPKANEEVDKSRLTQVGRALMRLAVDHIPAYSPEARGRSERMFGTLQDRLPKELKDARIGTLAAANCFLKERFINAYNRAFAVAAAEPGSACVPWVGSSLDDILCIQEERTVRADNCVAYKTLLLQIPPDLHRCHYVRVQVRVHEYPNGTLAVFHGPRCLARYDAQGRLLQPPLRQAA